jgi:uncharacterized protein GlcG (DUF336 family)
MGSPPVARVSVCYGSTGAIPIDGGVPLIVDGTVVGAVGVSGGSGEQDGHVAQAGAVGASAVQ